ncbi:hypothetical protein PAMA_016521 [Pampus argenteus]
MMEINRRVFVVTVHFITLSLAHHQERSVEDALEHTEGRAEPGLCSYGQTTSCCLGWRNVDNICQRKSLSNATSHTVVIDVSRLYYACCPPQPCARSHAYMDNVWDQTNVYAPEGIKGRSVMKDSYFILIPDVNECGFLERPCSQRCMNTHGSYRCYCEPGYTLNADGYTCSNVDECQRDADVCPPRRTCRNTFGSFVCVCQDGFAMGTLHGSVQCRDKDECLTGSHQCSRHAQCVNTDGSYTCQCLEAYVGNGRTCWPRRAPQSKAVMYFYYKLSKRTKPIQPTS